LPLPLWLWVAGAGATIVLTFTATALFFHKRIPHIQVVSVASFTHPLLATCMRITAAAVFVLTLFAGFVGVQDPYSNLITTMIWIVWWVGFAFVCALIGNLWSIVNPLCTLFPWTGRRMPYPEWLAMWPAVIIFTGFVWAELVWQDNDVPAFLARAMLAYAVLTWIAMFLFGRDTWLERGEAFSIAFGILARFAPLDERRRLLRPPGMGLLTDRPVPFSLLVFVLVMLASVTFDGFLETPLYQQIVTAIQQSPTLGRLLFGLSEWGLSEPQVIATAALLAFPLGFLAAYWLTSWLAVRLTRSKLTVNQFACAFVLTLVPIAVAYHLSHYFSLLATAGQFIIPLASDPFGFGWDLFGTARYKVDLGIVNPYLFWYGAVTLIVIGHVIAVVVAHLQALRVLGSRRAALVSQIPMVVLMIAYTTLSLWILAQPIVG